MPVKHRPVSPSDLAARFSEGGEVTLIDVRPAPDYRVCHLPHAVGNCVYEIQFPERMASLAPDRAKAVCVYGFGTGARDARMAAEKLVRAGYAEVLELRDGLEGWKEAGYPVVESSEKGAPSAPVFEGRREVDLSESRLEWVGRNLLNRHRGTLGLKAGFLEFSGGKPVGGEFAFDMNAITCENLRDDPLHDVLVDHLRSHDFFDTEYFPEGKFRLHAVEPVAGATPGAPDLRIEGELSLKDRTGAVAFEAVSGVTAEGRFAAQAVLSFDRTRWNVFYGSGRFFRNLGMHLVNDFVEVHVRVVTLPAS